jgi:serine/threonine protein kinase
MENKETKKCSSDRISQKKLGNKEINKAFTDKIIQRKLSKTNPGVQQIIGNFIITNEKLGKGASATVYLGYHKKKNIKVAVKKFELLKNDPRIKRRAHREIELLLDVKHPNIVKLYDFYFDSEKNNIYLFLEYCSKGCMKTFLGSGGYIEENHVKRIIKQLVSALKYLIIEKKIYHRDIKLQNILVSKNFNIKLSDFGLATMNMKGTFKRLCGSPLYMAPEILIDATYNKRSDLWSIGIVIFELMFGSHPFKNIKSFSKLINHFKNGIDIKIPPLVKPDKIKISNECIDIMKRLLVSDPRKRLNWEQFFNHPWLTNKLLNNKNINKTDDNINIIESTYELSENDTIYDDTDTMINTYDNNDLIMIDSDSINIDKNNMKNDKIVNYNLSNMIGGNNSSDELSFNFEKSKKKQGSHIRSKSAENKKD